MSLSSSLVLLHSRFFEGRPSLLSTEVEDQRNQIEVNLSYLPLRLPTIPSAGEKSSTSWRCEAVPPELTHSLLPSSSFLLPAPRIPNRIPQRSHRSARGRPYQLVELPATALKGGRRRELELTSLRSSFQGDPNQGSGVKVAGNKGGSSTDDFSIKVRPRIRSFRPVLAASNYPSPLPPRTQPPTSPPLSTASPLPSSSLEGTSSQPFEQQF